MRVFMIMHPGRSALSADMLVNSAAKHMARLGVRKTREPREVRTLCTDWSPERPRLTEPVYMLAQLAIGVGQAAIVPPEHDTGSASNGRIGSLQIGHQLVRHSDVVHVAKIVLQRFEQSGEFRNLLTVEQVFETIDRVAQFLDGNAKFVAPLQRKLGKTAS